MTTRSTADIVAELRELATVDPVKMYREWEIEAADRLAELETKVTDLQAELDRVNNR